MIAELLLLGLILCDLYLMAARRLHAAIRGAAAEGAILALLPLVVAPGEDRLHLAVICAITLAVKAIAIPALLAKAARTAGVDGEARPYLGRHASALVGLGLIFGAMAASTHLPLAVAPPAGLLLPAALSTSAIGLLLLISRRNAISQVIGYLTLENGVFVFGQLLPGALPLIVELGILLDLLGAVAIMSLVIFHIGRTFQHIDTHSLFDLRD